jgi:hypothetical protein
MMLISGTIRHECPETVGNVMGNDPSSQDQRSEVEERRQLAIARNRRDEAPIVRELLRAGFNVTSVADLRRNYDEYKDAVPILLRWLPRLENPAVKDDIVRDLTVKWARPLAGPLLVEEFKKVDDWHLRWAIGNALSVVADDLLFDQLVELVRDRRYGRGREMVAVALGNMKDARAVDVLLELLDDEEVAVNAIMALGKLKDPRTLSRISPFLEDPRTWVRQEAKKAIGKIERAQQKRKHS